MEPVDIRAHAIGRDQFGLATRAQLGDVAVSCRTLRRRLARMQWTRLARGVIDLGSHSESWRKGLMAVVLGAGEPAAVSYRSAAFLHRLLDVAQPVGFDVTVLRGGHTAVGDVALHTTTTLDPRDVCRVGPFPCTSIERTFLDLAAVELTATLEMMLWDGARRVADLPQRLVAAMLRHPGAPGRKNLDALVAALLPDIGRAESPLEIFGLLALRDAGAPPPVLQYEVRDAAGRFVARVDAAWPDARVIVEFDGAAYHDTPGAVGRDTRRLERLRALGWHVIVLRRKDLSPARCRAVVREIKARLAR